MTSEERASSWMHRGIDLLNSDNPVHLKEAVNCFDQAIALRNTPSSGENPRARYLLAGGWVNRGDALACLGGKEDLAEAFASYDKALVLLRTLPLGDDPQYPRRLAIAWINQGTAWEKSDAAVARTNSARCYREALAVLAGSPAAAIADLTFLRAGAQINLASALLNEADPPAAEARALAHQALALVEPAERNDAPAADFSFRARHVLCRAIAMESRDGKAVPPELIMAATDAVDEGLALARSWESRGETGFRSLADDLFRFGCLVYQAGPPHFLVEFILESLDPARSDGAAPLNHKTHAAAIDSLWGALKEIQRAGFSSLATPRFEQVLESLRELRLTEERLEQLRRTTIPTASR